MRTGLTPKTVAKKLGLSLFCLGIFLSCGTEIRAQNYPSSVAVSPPTMDGPALRWQHPVLAEHVWTRAADSDYIRARPVYMVLTNRGDKDVVLTGASSEVATSIAINILQMGPAGVLNAFTMDEVLIPAGKTVLFEPDEMYLSLQTLKKDLIPGYDIPIKLTFAEMPPVYVRASVGRDDAASYPYRGGNAN